MVARCLICNKEYTAEQMKTATCCPNCGYDGPPCDPQQDVTVHLNWHELRILAIWAENWAHHTDANEDAVYAITHRLEKQFPKEIPLTMVGELSYLRKCGWDIQTNHPGDDGT